MLYTVGKLIVHPMHGAGIIEKIIRKPEAEGPKEYYVLRFASGDMSVMLPAEKCGQVGLREIISKAQAEQLLTDFPNILVKPGDKNWNKRYRENMVHIRSGNPMEVAEVVKELMVREAGRGLSTGEKRMLRFAKDILVSEITLSMNATEDEIESQLSLAVG